MRSRTVVVSAACAVGLILGGCGQSEPSEPAAAPSATQSATGTSAQAAEAATDSIVGTVIRFTAPNAAVDVTIDQDNPAARDLLSMLPLTLTFEDFAGREKIAYLPRDLRFEGSPPSTGTTGDLALYTPWGNLAFYYDGEPGPPSEQLIHLGRFDASLGELEQLEGGEVTVNVVE